MINFKCDKCGKETIIDQDVSMDALKLNECHTVDLGFKEYGSKLDTREVKFNLCDDCLFAIFQSLSQEAQDKIYNSSTAYWDRFNGAEI